MENHPCQVFISPFDVLLPAGEEAEDEVTTVVQPDVLVICDASKITKSGARGVPDFIIEILSPSTAKKDLGDKFTLYERHGVAEYWVVDPYAEALHCWSLGESGSYAKERLVKRGESAVSTKLAGFSIDTEKLFSEPE